MAAADLCAVGSLWLHTHNGSWREKREREGDKMQATKAAMVKIWRVIIARHGDAKRERKRGRPFADGAFKAKRPTL